MPCMLTEIPSRRHAKACGEGQEAGVGVGVGVGGSSVVRTPDSCRGRGFESLQERRENFLLQGRLLTLISVSGPPPCYLCST